MMRREMALGVVVCGYIMVDVENRENEMIVDVRLPPSEMSVAEIGYDVCTSGG